MAALRYDFNKKTGTADTLATGSVIGGNAVDINDNIKTKVSGLSALVVVEAETNTFTFAGKWQVSNDGTTWVDVTNGPQNASAVTLATATAGDDAVITRAFVAPDAIYGWRKARFALVTGGTTGAAVDTYAISYCYRAIV